MCGFAIGGLFLHLLGVILTQTTWETAWATSGNEEVHHPPHDNLNYLGQKPGIEEVRNSIISRIKWQNNATPNDHDEKCDRPSSHPNTSIHHTVRLNCRLVSITSDGTFGETFQRHDAQQHNEQTERLHPTEEEEEHEEQIEQDTEEKVPDTGLTRPFIIHNDTVKEGQGRVFLGQEMPKAHERALSGCMHDIDWCSDGLCW